MPVTSYCRCRNRDDVYAGIDEVTAKVGLSEHTLRRYERIGPDTKITIYGRAIRQAAKESSR